MRNSIVQRIRTLFDRYTIIEPTAAEPKMVLVYVKGRDVNFER